MSWRRALVEHFVVPGGSAVPDSAVPGDGRPAQNEAAGAPTGPPGDGRWSAIAVAGARGETAGLERRARPSGAGAPASVAVLCAPADAIAVAGAVGLALAAWGRAPCVVVVVWSAAPEAAAARAPARPATRRLAASLAGRGLCARSAGRLAVVHLPTDEAEAVAAARRALAAGGHVPAVLAVAGPRGGPLDALIATQDLALVVLRADAEPSLGHLARESLAVHALPVGGCPVPSRWVRTLAASGLPLPPSARRVLVSALREAS